MSYDIKLDFQIDQQELENLSAQECFVLGFEYSTVYHLLNRENNAFVMQVHASNSARIRTYARNLGRKITLGHIHHGWRELLAEVTL